MLITLLVATLVSANIYPTEPIQATVWTADQPMHVSWIEDGTFPPLADMGPCNITLWRDTDTYLVTLAGGVDPAAKTCEVEVPSGVLKTGSNYTLRFSTVGGVVYSADFGIRVENGTRASTTTTTTTSTLDCTTSMTESRTPSGVPPPGQEQGRGQEQGQGQQRAASAGRRGASVDVEKLKFRFVFVIWPVLMGITMAL